MSEGIDLEALMGQVGEMQQQLMAAQEAAAAQVVEGVAGGGVVRIRVTGGMDFQAVELDPEVIDPGDPELLADLVLAALHDAVAKAHQLQTQAIGFDPASVDLGGLLGGGPGSVLDAADDDEDEDDDGDDDEEDDDPVGAAGAGGR
jgi:hypothetical protein